MARSGSIGLIVLALSACTRYAEVDPDRVGPGYVTGGGEWNTGGGISVAVRAEERGGVTVICGAWTTDRQSALSSELNESVVEAGSIYLGGRRVVQNLSFMPRVAYRKDLTGAPARCVASPLPWEAGFTAAAPVVRLPRMSFVMDSDFPDPVTFRPGPRPALVP